MAKIDDKKDIKIYCMICGKEKSLRSFYTSKQGIHDNNIYHRHYPICKKCIKDKVYIKGTKKIDKKEFRKMLEQLNLPFDEEVYKKAIDGKKETFGAYISILNFHHLGTANGGNDKEINNNEENSLSEKEIKEMKKVWGDYEENQLLALQSFYNEFVHNYESDTPAQRLNFKNAAKTQLMADIALQSNNISAYNQLMKTLSTILGDSNVKPVQATGAEANDQVTFGTLIKKYETTRPIHKQVNSEMKKYMTLYFPGHLAKMEGLHNELVDKYNKSLERYTIEDKNEKNSDDENEMIFGDF